MDEHTIVFYLNDEKTEIHVQYIVEEGHKVTEPDEPTKELETFIGWYIDDEPFDFNLLIADSYDIIAKWEKEPFVARAFIGEREYQSILLAVEDAIDGDTILLADETHNLDVLVDVNNLIFKPQNAEDIVVIKAKFTLADGLNGITFEDLHFTDNAEIHAPGRIDNFVFKNNKVFDLKITPSDYLPANREDINAFIRFYTAVGEDIVGNVIITDNEFSDIKSDIISIARTKVGKEIILKDNIFTNIEMSAIRFDGGYNNGSYTIEGNKFENDIGVENLAVIVFRAYSSNSGNTQTINIIDNEFKNVGSTRHPVAETHPGSGIITFSAYNENETIVTIEDNIFVNPSNAIHFRDNRGNHTKLSLSLKNNQFIDGTGFIFYESNYRETDTNIVLGENTYIVDEIEVEKEDISDRFIRQAD